MSRFKDLCNSDSDDEPQTRSTQRGRVRQVKRFKQIQSKDSEQQQTTEIIIPQKQTKQKNKNIQKVTHQQVSLDLKPNEYKQTSNLNASQKFIRQQLKPAQYQMQHYLQKMEHIKDDRKKYTNALNACYKDLQKVIKKIQQLRSQQLKNKYSNQKRQNKIDKISSGSQRIKDMQNLQGKIRGHLSKLMKQHQKTIQSLRQIRKQIGKTFDKVKYQFLDINQMGIYNQQKQQFEDYGIVKVYQIINKADKIIEQVTSFNK